MIEALLLMLFPMAQTEAGLDEVTLLVFSRLRDRLVNRSEAAGEDELPLSDDMYTPASLLSANKSSSSSKILAFSLFKEATEMEPSAAWRLLLHV